MEKDKETKVVEEVVSEVEASEGVEGGVGGEHGNPKAVEGNQGNYSPLQKYPQVIQLRKSQDGGSCVLLIFTVTRILDVKAIIPCLKSRTESRTFWVESGILSKHGYCPLMRAIAEGHHNQITAMLQFEPNTH